MVDRSPSVFFPALQPFESPKPESGVVTPTPMQTVPIIQDTFQLGIDLLACILACWRAYSVQVSLRVWLASASNGQGVVSPA